MLDMNCFQRFICNGRRAGKKEEEKENSSEHGYDWLRASATEACSPACAMFATTRLHTKGARWMGTNEWEATREKS